MEKFSKELLKKIEDAGSIGISGHLRPDGDCVGACISWYHYLKNTYPDKDIKVFLEHVPETFKFLSKTDEVITDYPDFFSPFDVFFSLDCSDSERLGKAEEYFNKAKCKVNIDHHVSNLLFGDFNYVEPNKSATCEVIYELLSPKDVTLQMAEAIYLGIIHDTGVFHHNSTSCRTMEIAGELMAYGIPFSKIIDETFYQKTLVQNQLLGTCLTRMVSLENGRIIASYINCEDMYKYNALNSDLEGIVDQLRITKGAEAAIFLHELEKGKYKVSLRANKDIDLSIVALNFGGGGHKMAAGCTAEGTVEEIYEQLVTLIKKQEQE